MCIETKAPVAWLEIDHGSDVNIAESDGKAAMPRSLEGLNSPAAIASAYPLSPSTRLVRQSRKTMENL
jgi:hypothetical protein